MTLRYPNTDGTVKGLLEVVSRDYEYEHHLSISPPPLLNKAPVVPIGANHTNQLVAKDMESVQQNSVRADKSSPQPPVVQSTDALIPSSSKRAHTEQNPDSRSFGDGDSSRTKRQRIVTETGLEDIARGGSGSSYSSGENPDWRTMLCMLVEAEVDVDNGSLERDIHGVARILRQIADANKPAIPLTPPEPEHKTLHRVACQLYSSGPQYSLDTDPPFLRKRIGSAGHLESANRVGNLELYLERNRAASFIVFQEYSCCTARPKESTMGVPGPNSLSLVILSESLLETLNQTKERSVNWKMVYPEFQLKIEMEKPHVWTYLGMEDLEKTMKTLQQEEDTKHLKLFLNYFRDDEIDQHHRLRELLSQGLTTIAFLEYLFAPGELLVQQDVRGLEFSRVVKLLEWPDVTYRWDVKKQLTSSQNLERKEETKCKVKIKFLTEQWDYDGNFQSVQKHTEITYICDEDSIFPITQLPTYPLRYAKQGTRHSIKARGEMFWKCRKRRYVEYSGLDKDLVYHEPKTRFMIDVAEFIQRFSTNQNRSQLKDEIGPSVLASEEPPGEDFVLLLPAETIGFHMHDKKWTPLLVCNICDVVWNQDAFSTLVLQQDTKDLIMALITNKIDTNQSTEFFHGKGNGLVILFHGPPGTGKTLTAESVAEYAKKPLYRVTCGDIGSKPEDVEKYLRKVLWLGKTWDCVVLLDEAEVFLQERAMNDIQRNALVSVFLRVLEYYDGILVLTSNRVGTFDEGFKSRIQLAIHYEKLTKSSRERVWENFISRLESFKSDDIDTGDLRRHVKELSDFEMNGRQIRNAVTTGRQLTMFKGKSLDFECLRHCIVVSRRFDNYLTSINEGMDDEDMAREDRLR